MEIALQFVILFVLLACSGLISGAEAAFFSLSPIDKETLRNNPARNAQQVLALLDKPQELLATILVFNNFVNVGIVILSSTLYKNLTEGLLLNETLKYLIEIAGITLIILLIGEVIPKIYATKNPRLFAKFMSGFVTIIAKLPPFSWIKVALVKSSTFIQRRARKKGFRLSTDELEAAIALTKEENGNEEEHKILEGIVKFGTTEACQIMKSRLEMVAVEINLPSQEVLNTILESGYSRIPVYEGSLDNVKGILFIKDLLPHLEKVDLFDWKSLIRKAFFVPENKKIDDLLKEFQSKKTHIAIVVDEYGGASGLVTLEDVLEEIVGDITDEFDEEDIIYTKVDDHTFVFEGRTALVDFYKVLEIDGKEFEAQRGEAETIGGFVVEKAGRIMKNNEFVVCDDIKLVVESSDKKRVKMIKAIIQKKQEDDVEV